MKKVDFALTVLGAMAVASCSTSGAPAVACGPDNVATTNGDAVAAVNAEASWYYAALDPIVLGGPIVAEAPAAANLDAGTSLAASNAAASAVAAAAGNYYSDSCATVTASGNVVTFTLDLCSGPLGLIASSGIFTVTLNVVGSSVNVQLAGNNVMANGGTFNPSTSGTFTVTNGQKTLQATSQSTGTGPNGNSIALTGMYDLVWPTGTGCAAINGSFSSVGSGNSSATNMHVNGYLVCTNKCPQSGTATSAFDGGSVTLTFSGTNGAACAGSNGTSANVPLNCP